MHAKLHSRFDGFELSALRVAPREGARKGGIVVVQEIFGLSAHIAAIAHACAQRGYEALAPSVFDRVERGFSAELTPRGVVKGRNAVAATPWDQLAGDLQAAIDALSPPVFILGFCYGGAGAWLAASRCTGLAAASCFYGRAINELIAETPKIPTILHYGKTDSSIPPEAAAAVGAAHPSVSVHFYDAGHGFCREGSADFDAASRDLALERTFALFGRLGDGD